MPKYDLRCAGCGNEFDISASMTERAEKRIACPECGSRELDAVFKSANFYVKGQKGPVCPNSHVCGANCHHAYGG